MNGRGGFVLSVVIWIVAILFLSVTYTLKLAKEELQLREALKEKIKLYLKTQEVLEKLKFYLLAPEKINFTSVENELERFPSSLELNGKKYNYQECNYSLTDASALIDVFVPPVDVLVNLTYLYNQNRKVEKEILRDSLLDWVDKDIWARPFGAEKEFYQVRKGVLFSPRNSLAIQSVDEIRLIRGFDEVDKKAWEKVRENLYFGKKVSKNLLLLKDELLKYVLHLDEFEYEYLRNLKKEKEYIRFIQRASKLHGYYDEYMTFYPSRLVKIKIECQGKRAKSSLKTLIDLADFKTPVFDYRIN